MRTSDLEYLAARLAPPVREFVRESRVRTAILVNRSGQVLAHHGFDRSFDIGNVAALAAATHSSSHALADLTGAGGWTHLHHAGRDMQLLLTPFDVGAESLVLVAIFGRESTLGLVQLFFDRLVDAVRNMPGLGRRMAASDVGTFETDLEDGLKRVLEESQEG